MKVKLTPKAQLDFADQLAWFKARSPTAGRRAALAIIKALDMLRAYPDGGSAVEIDRREKYVRFGLYGFVIEYERRESIIFVTRIYHGAQYRSRG